MRLFKWVVGSHVQLPCLVKMLPLRWVFQQCLDEFHENGLLSIHLRISALKDTISVTETNLQTTLVGLQLSLICYLFLFKRWTVYISVQKCAEFWSDGPIFFNCWTSRGRMCWFCSYLTITLAKLSLTTCQKWWKIMISVSQNQRGHPQCPQPKDTQFTVKGE